MTVMPLVTREDKDHQNRHGLLFNMGWIPFTMRHPTCREKIERVDRQKFTCFVGRLEELKNNSWFQGNAYQKGRLFYTSADLQDLAKSSELLNKEQASVAVLEQLHETGNFDERSSVRFGVDAHFTEQYPWAKTESGALQLATMPWEFRNDSKHYLAASIFSFIVGASVF
jgi:cytochrome oxidase assembly protein ShyY1